MGYSGKERRIHKVFVTRNTEYHVRRRVCVGVKDRRSGHWLRGHLALQSKIAGGIRFSTHGGVVPNDGMPVLGECLFFASGGRDLVTSAVVKIERPPRAVVETYPG